MPPDQTSAGAAGWSPRSSGRRWPALRRKPRRPLLERWPWLEVRVANLAAMAERLWRLPLLFAAALFVLSGPAHAFGRTDAVFLASLVGVTLAAVAVPMGLLSLRGANRREVGKS